MGQAAVSLGSAMCGTKAATNKPAVCLLPYWLGLAVSISDTNCQGSDPNCHSAQVNFLASTSSKKGKGEENHPNMTCVGIHAEKTVWNSE